MTKFPSIESFAHVFRDAVRGVYAKPKIKLHGTNGGVVVKKGKVVAQSRNNLLIESDNAGFAAWVREQEHLWADCSDGIIYGEWAGPGIQDRDAVTKILRKTFFVFAVLSEGKMITEPEDIAMRLNPTLCNVVVLPWFAPAATVTFENVGSFVEMVNEEINKIAVQDPFIFEHFGVTGPGEGLVYMPPDPSNIETFCRNTFKVKTEDHRVRKTVRAISVKIDIPKDAVDFVLTFVTPARCQQAVTEACNGNRAPELTRDFLKWMGSDVRKESMVELEGMGVEWGGVAKFVNDAARKWFLAA